MRKFRSRSHDLLLEDASVSENSAGRPPPPRRSEKSRPCYPIGDAENALSPVTVDEARLSRQASEVRRSLRKTLRIKKHHNPPPVAGQEEDEEDNLTAEAYTSVSDHRRHFKSEQSRVLCNREASPAIDSASETITVSESPSSAATDHTNERLGTTSQRRLVHQQTRPRRQSAQDASPANTAALPTPCLEVYANDLLNETRLSSELLNERVRAACSNLPKNITTGFLLSTPASRIVAASISVGTFDFLCPEGDTTTSSTNGRTEGEHKSGMTFNAKRSRSIRRLQHQKRTSKLGNALAPMLTEQLGFAAQMGKTRKETVAGMKLASENGLVFKCQLQDKEYVFLNASEFGEVEIVRELLNDRTLNVDCVDYMGRNAILLAMKTENIELIDCLVGRLNFYAVEDALLNAISQEKIHIVKLIIDHPQYIRMEKIMTPRGQRAGIITKSTERSQFSSDITPLMLAAHTNNHEIIQLLLDRGLKVEMPHDRSCLCLDCESIRAQVSFQYSSMS
ncbi:unnamed protein product [Dibothriocephalus latus]|uniref:Uncharacterized protein n=1 Tax=Dibothriocephalus latus TaxID=60516 RepID=A0A3P7P3F6_DIBLA|nr:unnamed protein product [Dibothriocephalus latus]